MSASGRDATEPSENRSWVSIHSLLTNESTARLALIGAPLVRESITPGRYDLAPDTIRSTLKRLSVYDLETRTDLSKSSIYDAGNLPIAGNTPSDALAPLAGAVRDLSQRADLTIVLGGHNGVTRPSVHGAGTSLKSIGLLTLDAHFDLRDTDGGLNNGNPIQALLDDGVPGTHISQVGLAPFANTIFGTDGLAAPMAAAARSTSCTIGMPAVTTIAGSSARVMMTAPAPRSMDTSGASRDGVRPAWSGEPFSVGMSAVSMMSLSPTGMPCRGPRYLPAAISASSARSPTRGPARCGSRSRVAGSADLTCTRVTGSTNGPTWP